jgi:radical SAM superfamily enzyme YgiQ (UPF0313 family)
VQIVTGRGKVAGVRIALIYPPPWKLAADGEDLDLENGPPPNYQPGDLDPDFHQTPYGLLSLGAQAERAGHSVKLFNLSAFDWSKVEEIVSKLDAQVFGMSCWTANRRGVALVAELIRKLHPQAHIVVGGPHATPLAKEMLEHHAEIDTVCEGESEHTFLELLDRLEADKANHGLAGAWYREEGKIAKGPPRPAIEDLDSLASPHDYYDTHIVMTSRGCPWQCTFCGAETTWGRGFRGQSVGYVVNSLRSALQRAPVKMLQIKDDTFTANRKRAMAISKAIREAKLNFLWSCDTRVDVLSEELLKEMRLAGCQRLSLGVESGSDEILQKINKKISVEEILEATQMAKKYGIAVRFYMMLGNRGETQETFQQTLQFLDRAKPHQYIYSCLSVYPGTTDFHDAEAAGWLDRHSYFREKFQELKVPFDATEELTEIMQAWFVQNKGVRNVYQQSVADAQSVLELLGDHHAANIDLAGAYFREGNWAKSREHVERALRLDYPAPGLAYNYLACIAEREGDLPQMQAHFMTAAKTDPQHAVLIENVQAARYWFAAQGPARGVPLQLKAQHEFALFEKTKQPALPGPLPEDYATFPPNRRSPPQQTDASRHLRVIS